MNFKQTDLYFCTKMVPINWKMYMEKEFEYSLGFTINVILDRC